MSEPGKIDRARKLIKEGKIALHTASSSIVSGAKSFKSFEGSMADAAAAMAASFKMPPAMLTGRGAGKSALEREARMKLATLKWENHFKKMGISEFEIQAIFRAADKYAKTTTWPYMKGFDTHCGSAGNGWLRATNPPKIIEATKVIIDGVAVDPARGLVDLDTSELVKMKPGEYEAHLRVPIGHIDCPCIGPDFFKAVTPHRSVSKSKPVDVGVPLPVTWEGSVSGVRVVPIPVSVRPITADEARILSKRSPEVPYHFVVGVDKARDGSGHSVLMGRSPDGKLTVLDEAPIEPTKDFKQEIFGSWSVDLEGK